MPARKVARDYDFLGVNRVKNLADPVDARDAVNLQYLQGQVQSLQQLIQSSGTDLLEPVDWAFLFNVDLQSDINTQTQINLSTGTRVALAGQDDATENGIYTVGQNGTLQLVTADSDKDNKLFVVSTGLVTSSTTELYGTFIALQRYDSGTGERYIDIAVPEDGVYAISTLIGDGTANQFNISHWLGTKSVIVKAYEVATGDEIELGVKVVDDNTVQVEAYPAPGNNAIRVVVFGHVQL